MAFSAVTGSTYALLLADRLLEHFRIVPHVRIARARRLLLADRLLEHFRR